MNTLRTSWLAVLGSILLLTLSTAGALGHVATGQTDAASGDAGASTAQTDTLETTDEGDELTLTHPENHGGCVSAVAQTDTVGGLHVNHGGGVSEAARVTCWTTEEAPEDVTPDENGDSEDDVTTTHPDNHGGCVSAVAQSDAVGVVKGNHGEAVSEAARVTCRDPSDETPVDETGDEATTDEDSDKEVAKAAKKAAKDQAKADRRLAKEQAKADKQQAKADRKTAKEQAKADKRLANGH